MGLEVWGAVGDTLFSGGMVECGVLMGMARREWMLLWWTLWVWFADWENVGRELEGQKVRWPSELLTHREFLASWRLRVWI